MKILNNTWYALRALDPKNASSPITEAELYIYDEIGGWGVTANELRQELKALPESVETIHLRINSPGGSVIEGNTVFNLLARHKARVITHIDGLAASMGSVIALAGDEVHMADNALFMIHNPWTFAQGDAEQLRKDANLLDTVKATILNAYARSNHDQEKLSELMDAETWFTAAEAKEAGFVDHVSAAFEAAALTKALGTDFAKELHVPENLLPAAGAQHQAMADQHQALQKEAQGLREKLEAAEAKLTKQGEKHTAAINKLVSEHETALTEAKAIKEKEVSDRAAHILAEVGQPPLVEPFNDFTTQAASSDEAIREQYKALCKQYPAGTPERSDFFDAHKKILSYGA